MPLAILQADAANLGEVLDYVLKGAGETARRRLGLRRKQFGGVVTGKRCGTSENIGRAAREAKGAGCVLSWSDNWRGHLHRVG
jgi:hypothetical protein